MMTLMRGKTGFCFQAEELREIPDREGYRSHLHTGGFIPGHAHEKAQELRSVTP